MARKKKSTQVDKRPWFDDIEPQTRQAILAVVVAVVGVFFLLSLLGYAGVAGKYASFGLTKLFGIGAWLSPLASGAFVYALLSPRPDNSISLSKIIGITLLFWSLLGGLQLFYGETGGWLGLALIWPLTSILGNVVTGVMVFGLLIISVLLTFNVGFGLPKFGLNREREDEDYEDEDLANEEEEVDDDSEEDEVGENEEEAEKKQSKLSAVADRVVDVLSNKTAEIHIKNFSGPYIPPSLSLLEKDKGKPVAGDIKANANIIKRTLRDFGINVEMDAVESGPTITRYSLKPAQGVRISRIAALQQELQLALKASTIRIEAPIPGKSLVGIEVPNTSRSTIGLASILTNPEFTDSPHPLLVGLGKDVAGGVHFANVARMPHTLIAGTTGSGKSVMMHNLIISLLFRNSPEQLRFFMVDPKRVELTLYNGIPHLMAPVITDAKKVLKSLGWAVREMERRYDILEAEKVQNLGLYHANVYGPAKKAWEENGSPEEEYQNLPEALPYIVIVVDELNDLMQSYPRELEALIVRLAQMSRAVGIHLILATQRPSVNVITGTIKANIPTRIAFNVASQIDSRTILDQMGAEKLLGQGDMLYLSSDNPKLTRLQSPYISGKEIEKIVSYLKAQDADSLDTVDLDAPDERSTANSFMASLGGHDDGAEDELFEEAKQAVLEGNRASTSYLQRKLRIGYSRAARLMDVLEEQGIIGPQEGAKPREILVGKNVPEVDEEDYDNESDNATNGEDNRNNYDR